MNETPNQENKSRFAELAIELMGAKMASDFMKEVWERASPELKQELADKLVAKSVEITLKDNWSMRSVAVDVLESELRPLILAELKKRDLPQLVEEAVREKLDDSLEKTARYALEAALQEVKNSFRWSRSG